MAMTEADKKRRRKPLRNIGKSAATKRATLNLFGFLLPVISLELPSLKNLYSLKSE